MFWVIVMLESPTTNYLHCSGWGKEVLVFTVHGPIHWPLNAVKSSCNLSRKTAPKQNFSTSVLDCEHGVLSTILSIFIPPDMVAKLWDTEFTQVAGDQILIPLNDMETNYYCLCKVFFLDFLFLLNLPCLLAFVIKTLLFQTYLL